MHSQRLQNVSTVHGYFRRPSFAPVADTRRSAFSKAVKVFGASQAQLSLRCMSELQNVPQTAFAPTRYTSQVNLVTFRDASRSEKHRLPAY